MAELTDAELLARYAASRDEAAFADLARRHGPMVYAACRRLLNDAAAAEDAAQAVFLLLARKAGGLAGRPVAGWLHRAAVLLSKESLRAARRRARAEKEAAEMRQAELRGVNPDWEALRPELDAALAALPRAYRDAVVLGCVEGRPEAEVARELGVPVGTVKSRLSRGLSRLRARLGRREAALSAAALGALLASNGTLAIPASLAMKLAAMGGASAAATAGPAKALMERAMKTMFWTKVKLAAAVLGGVVLLGGGTATVGTLLAAENGKPPEPPKSKFTAPVWDPSAEWERAGFYASSGASGDMDGPRMDFMGRRSPGVSAVSGIKFEGNEKVTQAYDLKLDRIHVAAGSATGYLDGPFSRARFVGGHYSARGKSAGSLDGRYVYETEPQLKHCMRRIDYAKQEVRTLTPDVKGGFAGLVAGKKHALYALTGGNEILFMDADAKVEGKVTAQLPEKQGIGGWGCTLALDEEHERLYASRQFVSSIEWLIWYWDLKDGSFHGILPNKRQGKQTGPLEGTGFYPELWVRFGPDDPPKNNIWFGCTDMGNVWRLDQTGKEIWALAPAEGSGKNVSRIKWVGKGEKMGGWTAHGSFSWVPDGSGDFYIGHDGGGPTIFFKRVK